MTFRAITATLTLRTALHVGTGKDTETTDDLLRRDARGRLLIPGTAIAGALRSIATRLAPRFDSEPPCQALKGEQPNKACQCLVCQLFGDVNPQEDNEEAVAARVLVYDAVLDTAPSLTIRDGVGIDRVTGAAARRERIKFDYEALPAGTTFKLRLEIDSRLSNEQRTLPLLAAALAEWEQGRGAVGGRVGRGLGAFSLSDVQWIERDLMQPDTLIEFLRNGPPWHAADGDHNWLTANVKTARGFIRPYSDTLPVARSWVLAEFTLAATGPFLTHDPTQAGRGGFDHAPVLTAYDQNARPVLPGSSLRGALRSQAERIARTLATLKAWDNGKDTASRKAAFLTLCPACNPLTTKTDDPVASCNSFIKALPKAKRDELEQEGAEEKLCLACQLFGSSWNGSRLRVEDAPFVGEKVERKVLDFLAIDRFTGGGRDTAKFDAVVLWKPKFRARLFLENPAPWELGWLALVLRDLHDGLITVGFGAAKGFGRCNIEDWKITFGFLVDEDFPLPGNDDQDPVAQQAVAARQRLLDAQRGTSGVFQTLAFNQATAEDWLVLAEGWVKAFNTQVTGHQHAFGLKKDSYFDEIDGKWLPDLYPARVS
ncbi:RAMP superfamily CRISPR-associated protein [uncultured Chloroflexus sp.]|uniref:RAMP superfamily CRISPR-associated protein n=1 Tax=uncultured Chloroflexus sp. TaxID=214040 RepID=UPI00261896D8|nr:RAMP superfamily CRISPR-associated protein [uncultured Chloroflexus sp.]